MGALKRCMSKNFYKLEEVRVCVCLCLRVCVCLHAPVCVRGTSVDLKDEGSGERCQAIALISNPTQGKSGAKQCAASRLLIDTSDYPEY